MQRSTVLQQQGLEAGRWRRRLPMGADAGRQRRALPAVATAEHPGLCALRTPAGQPER